MFRALWYLTNLIVVTIYYGVKVIVCAAVFRIPARPNGVYDRIGRSWSSQLLRSAGVKVTVRGVEHIPLDTPVVYVSNHQSWFDILAIEAMLPGTVRFVSKKELAKVPVLGAAMRRAGHIFIDRHNRARALGAYEDAAVVVRERMSAVVFAEGTRSRTGELLPFKKGPFVFAIAAQVPLVPLYCAGTFEILPKGSIRVRPKPVTIYVGEPIPTAGLDYEDRQQLLEKARATIESMRDQAGANRDTERKVGLVQS